MNTEESNKLIAEFMGEEIGHADTTCGLILFNRVWTRPKYNNSWDWLMPVIDKIFNIPLLNGYFQIKYIKESLSLSVDIESTYNEVIDYIKWYNLNK